MVIDGTMSEVSNDFFQDMVNELYEEPITQTSEEEPKQTTSSRWNEDGTYNSKPLDKNYFKNYYQNKLACKIDCPDCGRKISKTNLSKHRQTAICKNIRNRNVWNFIDANDEFPSITFQGWIATIYQKIPSRNITPKTT